MSFFEIAVLVWCGASIAALIWIGWSLSALQNHVAHLKIHVLNSLSDRDEMDADEAAERFKAAIEEAGITVVRSAGWRPKPGSFRYAAR